MTTHELRTIAAEMAMEEATDKYWNADCEAGYYEAYPAVTNGEWHRVWKMRMEVSKFLQNKSYDEVIEMETEEVISKVFGNDYNSLDEAIEDEVAFDTSYRALKDERQAQRNFVGRYNQIPAYA